MYSLLYYHDQIGNTDHWSLLRFQSWNNGMRCVLQYSYYHCLFYTIWIKVACEYIPLTYHQTPQCFEADNRSGWGSRNISLLACQFVSLSIKVLLKQFVNFRPIVKTFNKNLADLRRRALLHFRCQVSLDKNIARRTAHIFFLDLTLSNV